MEHTNEDDSTISVITGIDRSYSEVDVGSSNRKDGESMYSSEDFDDQSTTGEKSAEDEFYGDDDEDHYSQYSDSLTTEGGSTTNVADPATLGQGMMKIATVQERTVKDTESNALTYSYEDHAEEDSTSRVMVPPSLQSAENHTVEQGKNLDHESPAHPSMTDVNAVNTTVANDDADDHTTNSSDKNTTQTCEKEASTPRSLESVTSVLSEDMHETSTKEGIEGKNTIAPEETDPMYMNELTEKFEAMVAENAALREKVAENDMITSDGFQKDRGDREEELEMLKSQVEAARAMIMSSLDIDDDVDGKPEKGLLQLILLAESQGYKKAVQNADPQTTKQGEDLGAPPAVATATDESAADKSRAALEHRVESLQRELSQTLQESRSQSERAASLQRDLDAIGAGGTGGTAGRSRGEQEMAVADIFALKAKATQLVDRLRQEKTARLKSERDARGVTKKVQLLSDHIEKLMMFLKHEATQKAKAHEQQRRLQKELELVKARSTALLRSNQAKERVMTELREGSSILEDQLRLMDEKYMELRTKLDWTRQKADKDVRRARAKASALRTKWALLCGEGRAGDNSLLDSVTVETAAQHLGHSSLGPGGMPQHSGERLVGRGTGGEAGVNGSSSRGRGIGLSGQVHGHQQHSHCQARRGRSGAGSGGNGASAGGSPSSHAKGGDLLDPWNGRGSGGHGPGVGGLGDGGRAGGRAGAGGAGVGGGLGVCQYAPGGGKAIANLSESAKLMSPKRVASSGGRIDIGRGLEGGWGGSPPGANLTPGLSAGSDPGGGLLGRINGSGSRGIQRSPWSEQGTSKVATSGSTSHGTQLLFA